MISNKKNVYKEDKSYQILLMTQLITAKIKKNRKSLLKQIRIWVHAQQASNLLKDNADLSPGIKSSLI